MPTPHHPLTRLAAAAALALAASALPACSPTLPNSLANAHALQRLAQDPLPTSPWTSADVYGSAQGHIIRTPHYRIFTTISDPTYQHLLARTLEASHARMALLNPNTQLPPAAPTHQQKPLDCYVFHSRAQWETYTRARAGSNAPIYLQISAGGYCQEGVFAGYDIGREQTLSVVSHEAWHQYSWFAFKDRLPSWLEEGLATQNEAIEWHAHPSPAAASPGTPPDLQPVFRPAMNFRRFSSLQTAVKNDRLWKLQDLLSTHAGQVIKMNQQRIDAYYAQLWSLVLFLEQSPTYRPRLQSLLADASHGKLTHALAGTGVTQRQIDNFTEKWNTVAGPTYTQKYFHPDLNALEKEYLAWAREFTRSWPPTLTP